MAAHYAKYLNHQTYFSPQVENKNHNYSCSFVNIHQVLDINLLNNPLCTLYLRYASLYLMFRYMYNIYIQKSYLRVRARAYQAYSDTRILITVKMLSEAFILQKISFLLLIE